MYVKDVLRFSTETKFAICDKYEDYTESKEIWAALKIFMSHFCAMVKTQAFILSCHWPLNLMHYNIEQSYGECGSSHSRRIPVALSFFLNKSDWLNLAIYASDMVILVTREQLVPVLRWSSSFQLFWFKLEVFSYHPVVYHWFFFFNYFF